MNIIAVGLPYQRRGIGKLLLEWGLERAVADGKGSWLVGGPQGIRLYEANGYEKVVSTFEGVELWLMRKRPSTR